MSDIRVSKKQALTALENIQDYGPMARVGKQNSFDQLHRFVDQNPTHHAVIDEYGEIIYARRISGLLDAVEQCEYYIEQCRKDPVTRHSAKSWTVKEVTLHE